MSIVVLESSKLVGKLSKLTRLCFSEAPIFVIAFVYCAIVIALRSSLNEPGDHGLSLYNRSFFILLSFFVSMFFILFCCHAMVVVRPRRLTQYLYSTLKDHYLTPSRLVPGFTVLLLFLPFIAAFTAMKTTIHQINPFSWDRDFAELDKLIHGGLHPWELLHPLLAEPFLTSALNAVYHAWFFILFGVLFWQAFSRGNAVLRMQFLISFLLCWAIIGSFAAVIYSSAGPVYFERLLGEDGGYKELFVYLAAAAEHWPVWALDVQEKLWQAYEAGNIEKGAGISAMPSMHVAIATLLVFMACSYGRLAFSAAFLFAFLILVGSVHLGWHYAVDGYLAVVLVALIWYPAGWFVRRFWSRYLED